MMKTRAISATALSELPRMMPNLFQKPSCLAFVSGLSDGFPVDDGEPVIVGAAVVEDDQRKIEVCVATVCWAAGRCGLAVDDDETADEDTV